MQPKAAFSVKEVREATGISRNLIFKLILTGRLKHIKAGDRKILIPAWALDEFLRVPSQ